MTDYRDILSRTRDTLAALQRADSALAEAAGLMPETLAGRLLEALREVLAAIDSEITARRTEAFEALQAEQKSAFAAKIKPLCEHCPDGSTILVDADSQECEKCGRETFSPVAKLLIHELAKVDMPDLFIYEVKIRGVPLRLRNEREYAEWKEVLRQRDVAVGASALPGAERFDAYEQYYVSLGQIAGAYDWLPEDVRAAIAEDLEEVSRLIENAVLKDGG